MIIRLSYLIAITLGSIGVIYGTSSQGLNASPMASVTTLNNRNFELGTRGTARLVSFYSPDCAYSRRNTTGLSSLHDQYQDRDINIIAVAMSYDTTQSIEAFSQQYEIPYHLAHDTDGSIASAFPNFRFTPTTFLIDKQGKIVWRQTGRMSLPIARQQLEQAVGK